MARFVGMLGSLLILLCLTGLTALLVMPEASPRAAGAPADRGLVESGGQETGDTRAGVLLAPPVRLIVPAIGLDTAVVPARVIERNGALTWEVPAYVAGYARSTHGDGGWGNLILFGHVSSRNAGNVFEDLERVQPGDVADVLSSEARSEFRVTTVQRVKRDDVRVLSPTEKPALTLITCTGLWLPLAWDYAERLVIRAEPLAEPGGTP